jgi:hypothetical protein
MKPMPPADVHQDLLRGFPHGWKDGNVEPLDPAQRVRNLCRLPKRLSEDPVMCWFTTSGKKIHHGRSGLLYIALAEIGWKISGSAARDALSLALSSQLSQAQPPPARPQEEEFF